MLEHLARPHDVDGVLVERQRAVLGREARIEARDACPRAAQRLLRDVDGDDGAPGGGEVRREGAVARAEVEHAVAPRDVLQQERAARGEPLGPRVLGHRPPHRLAPGLHGWQRCHMTPLTTFPGA